LDANWAYLIDAAQTETLYKGYLQIPATRFRSAEEQWGLVNDVVEAVLKSVPGFARSDLEALEWCLSEITDNVINHADSAIGGLAQLSNRSQSRKIEFAICDVGVSIPKTLRPSHPEIFEDYEALKWAIKEGVTRDPLIGQGNGLFGSSEVCSGSGGFISIQSGRGSLHKNSDGLSLKNQKIPYAGTLVDGCISYAEPGQLAKALKFQVTGSDFISLRYELDDNAAVIQVRSEVQSVGARFAASPIRVKALNLLRMASLEKVVVDFSGVSIISSSFADEALGKLAVELGLSEFQAKVQLNNASPTIISLVSRAVQQRLARI
jgi:anti-anti-sigma regulatory factor